MRSARERGKGGAGGKGCWQKASIIDILPRSTTVTGRRKFSPGSLSLSERYLLVPPSSSLLPPPPPPSSSPLANKKIGRQSFAVVKTKSVDDGSTITVCSRPPWTVILVSRERGSEEGGSKIETITPRFQRWSNTPFLQTFEES